MKKRKLNIKQETFCNNYIFDKECFGNATKSYAKAYNLDLETKNDLIRPLASRLLTNNNIKIRLEELMNEIINDTKVDKALAEVILQKDNLQARINAIKEYNKVKSRITEKVDVTSKGDKIIGFDFVRPKD